MAHGDLQVPGELASAATGSATATYRYDASGNLLVVNDGGTATLYLPGEEVTATGSTVTATRYYTLGGRVVAARTNVTGSGTSALDWLLNDPHGTAATMVDASAQASAQRHLTPYGQPRGATVAWPGTKGFGGGTTGLTNLGAREYNPANGAFIAPDPVLNPADPTDPTDLDPYDYAANNPATLADPSGLCAQTWCPRNVNRTTPGPTTPDPCNPPPPPPAWITGNSGGILMGHPSIEPAGPTAPLFRQMTQNYNGGAASFLAGIGHALLSPLDLLSGCSTCNQGMLAGHLGIKPGSLAMGGSITGDYMSWLHHCGVPTGQDSWFGAGIGTAAAAGTIMAGVIAGPADAAAAADGTDLPESSATTSSLQHTGLNVQQSPAGGLISGWQLNPEQLWNVLNRGSL